MTPMSEGVLVEIEQRALRLEMRSLDDEGEIKDYLGVAVAEDVSTLAALVRSLQAKQ